MLGWQAIPVPSMLHLWHAAPLEGAQIATATTVLLAKSPGLLAKSPGLLAKSPGHDLFRPEYSAHACLWQRVTPGVNLLRFLPCGPSAICHSCMLRALLS
jgi:hypothetical protein